MGIKRKMGPGSAPGEPRSRYAETKITRVNDETPRQVAEQKIKGSI
jgi:hypothetical protein